MKRREQAWTHVRMAAATVLGATVFVLGCNAVLGIGDPISAPVETPPPEAGAGVGFWSGPGDRGCLSAKAPTPAQRPSIQSTKEIPPIYLAIQSVRRGSTNETGQLDNNAWQTIGFDLDGLCTGADTCTGTDSPPSCKPTVPQISTDGQLCRDNTFGRLMYATSLVPEVSNKYGLNDDAITCALCVGDYNYLLRISGYNGEPNDDQVRVDLYPSPGLEKPLPWNCADSSWKDHPCFTPDEQFTITSAATAAPSQGPDLTDAVAFDDAAYVRDGYLVFQLPDNTMLWFPGYKASAPEYPMRFQTATVAGKLAKDADEVWRVTDGTIGGRILGTELVKGFRELGICEQDPNYSVLVDFVTKNLDVLADGRTDPSATCDAMSAGVAFTAQQVLAGKQVAVEPLTECVFRGSDAGAADAQ